MLMVSTLFVGLVGCGGGGRELMPTPNLCVGVDGDPFADVPETLRSSTVDVMYVTDRKPVIGKDGAIRYGAERSHSLAFGMCLVQIGKGLSWETLVENTSGRKRSKSLAMSLSIVEQARLPETPLPLVKTDKGLIEAPAAVAKQDAIVKKFHDELRRRLAKTPTKEAYVYVHGFNNSFESGAFVIGELWHFFGRRGVPITYSWPAGAGLNIRGYSHDRESGEFTVFHLKQFLRVLGALEELEKIHIIAHSRGTHVATSALRELFIEARGAKLDPQEVYKIGNVVLASPDLDLDVTIQRLGAERFFRGTERVTIYVTAKDRAIGFSNWLFGSRRRVGQMSLADLSPALMQKLAGLPHTNFISARVKLDFTGHDYYRSNPAVSSDLILLLRDNREPGAANGRPLTEVAGNYWRIEDGYRNTK
jgi:esterase/lipase superfamily enzyme